MLLVPVELMPRQPDQPARMAQLRNTGGYILIFLCTLATYAPALNGGPLWDDDTHLTRPAMRSIHGLWRIWFDPGATQQSYPLLQTTFWIEHRMWGDAALGYHLANVALHSISAWLLVAILRRQALPGAWLAGFIFALHPVCAEAVAWISEQKSTLSAAFYFGSALMYLDFDHARRKSHPTRLTKSRPRCESIPILQRRISISESLCRTTPAA